MKTKTTIKIVILLLLILGLSLSVSSVDRSGCCCKEGKAYKGSFVRESTCADEAPDYQFSVPSTDFVIGKSTSTICTDYCEELEEFPTVTIEECGSPSYIPAPENVQLKPVKGKRQISLTWMNKCSSYINGYEISRCQGECKKDDFTTQVISEGYIDQADLKWGEEYTYKIKTLFTFGKESQEVTVTGSTGDIECKNQGENSFCISKYYYEQFKDYLSINDYVGTSYRDFKKEWNKTRDLTFDFRYNKAFTCDDYNKLNNILSCDATKDEACIASGLTANCAEKVECKEQAAETPFGLYATQDSCEGTEEKKYCYYDKSHSVVNDCFFCNLGMTCYDYRTKGACQSDNCGTGSCEWHDTYPLLGLGVCVDTRFDNCALCDQKGNFNVEAYNEVFDKCTPTKAKALETSTSPCFYDSGAGQGCSQIGCADYSSSAQCAAPSGGIQLDEDNKLISKSNDPCGIGVCEFVSGSCVKNANGKIDGTTVADCSKYSSSETQREECERDYFPPQTDFVPESKKIGRVDFFNIRIRDKTAFTNEYAYITTAQRKDYPTYFCVYSGTDECSDYHLTITNRLVIDNLILGEQTSKQVKILGTLDEGKNTIRYYTEDPNRNIEEIKEVSFNTCDGCQGPSLLDFNFTGAREFDGIYYTSNPKPSINLLFSTITTLTTKEIAGMNKILGTTALTTNNQFFTITSFDSLSDGNYKFKIDGVNSKNIPMEEVIEIPFVFDSVPPTVRILVQDKPAGAEVYEKSSVKVKLEFSEAVTLEEITLVKPDIGDYAVLGDEEEITEAFKTTNNAVYTASLTLIDGPNQIKIHALDYAGNVIFDAVTFNIFTTAPAIILKSPSYGVSATPGFDLVVETTNPAACRFWFNGETPVIPAPEAYDLLEEFTTTGHLEHSKAGINRIPDGQEKIKYPLTVQCTSKNGDVSKMFYIEYDTTEPELLSAIAHPNPVIQIPFETHLKVTTTPVTFCKYDTEQKSFAQMKGMFPGYARIPQESHDQLIEVDDLGSYTYHISCVTLAELGPVTAAVKFDVKEGVAFAIISKTPEFSKITALNLALETNKDALCYYSDDVTSIGALIGDGKGSTSHVAATTGLDGYNNYFITCTTTGRAVIDGIPESKKLNVTVFVGDKPPMGISEEEGACENNILDGDETDTDCGGSCPSRCEERDRCLVNSDCEGDLRCVEHPTAGFDVCASEELISEFERMRDDDNDGLPNWWEEKYYGNKISADPTADDDEDCLTNLEEYQYYERTGFELDPTNEDTDGDGWSDGEEILAGTDPTDMDIHPPSTWWIWLLAICLLLILLALGGYIVYTFVQKKKEEEEKVVDKKIERVKADVKVKTGKEKIAEATQKIKSLLIPKKKDYPSLSELKEDYAQSHKSKKQKSREIFDNLRGVLEGKSVKGLEHGKVIGRLRELRIGEKEPVDKTFESLIKLAVNRYPKEKRLALLKKLQLLKAGLLTEKEKEDLFKELREVAKYWKSHKQKLKKEIDEWIEKKPFHFVKKEIKKPKKKKYKNKTKKIKKTKKK